MKSAPLKWHGGKHYLASRIIEHFPPHTHYVEPFFGGGAVLFAKPSQWVEGYSEVANDINGQLMNFWWVLRDKDTFPFFLERCQNTPFSQVDFEDSLRNQTRFQDYHQAWGFFVRFRQSRQGLGKDFATLSRNRTRRGMNEQVSSWLSAIDGLPEAHERLKRVVIFNDEAVKVIKQQDGKNTLFYCDPPYLHETRTTTNDYESEMTPEQHEELLEVLAGIEGKFILSGYPSKLYDEWAYLDDWRCDEIQIDNKASGKKTKDIKTECLWMNF